MTSIYKEPLVSFLVLDFKKEDATRKCLESIRNHVKFPHKIIYLHNGKADYPIKLFEDGLVDQFIQTVKNDGLGIGTRNLFAASFSEFSVYWQNDQIMARDFTEEELDYIDRFLIRPKESVFETQVCMSISLAGPVCGQNIYSERAHIIRTSMYKAMEHEIPLSYGGAGPYHHAEWREGQIQNYYKQNDHIHLTEWPPMAIDNGKEAIRQNPDGSLWKHQPDRKGLWLISGPVKEKYIYPKFTDQEWDQVISTQSWPDGKIPENEIKDSFHVWN